jgi:glycosyltransferase involved in cell wall biosynthesis
MTIFTIIIPIHNEEGNIPLIVERINGLNVRYKYEILFVDDGSTDNSWNIIKKLNLLDVRIKGISFSRNFGHQIALSAGIDNCKSDFAIMMDGDLQHPPENIPKMINLYEKGQDVVQMVKKNQGRRNIIQKISSHIFYTLFKKISGVKISNNVSDFRLISKKVIGEIKKFNEKERFIRGIVNWVGFNYTEIKYEVGERKYGKSKYNIFALTRLASFGIFGFSSFPLKISFYLGILFSILSFMFGIYAIIYRLISPEVVPVGYTDIIVMITFIGGIQFIFLGILGSYISKIFDQVKDRPTYVVNEKI